MLFKNQLYRLGGLELAEQLKVTLRPIAPTVGPEMVVSLGPSVKAQTQIRHKSLSAQSYIRKCCLREQSPAARSNEGVLLTEDLEVIGRTGHVVDSITS